MEIVGRPKRRQAVKLRVCQHGVKVIAKIRRVEVDPQVF